MLHEKCIRFQPIRRALFFHVGYKCSNRASDNQLHSRILLQLWLSVKLQIGFFLTKFLLFIVQAHLILIQRKDETLVEKIRVAMLQEVNEHDTFPCLRYMHFPNLKNYWSTISVQYFGAPCFNEGWRNHRHHLEITLVIKMYGTDSILLQDYTQFPDWLFEWASKWRLILILEKLRTYSQEKRTGKKKAARFVVLRRKEKLRDSNKIIYRYVA